MITNAQGVPDIKANGGAVQTLYSKKWNLRYWQTGVLPAITTAQYFDQLQKGDKVEITNEPTVTFRTYANGQKFERERVNLTSTSVVIDQAGYFNVVLSPVDKELSHLDLANKYLSTGQKEGQKFIDQAFFTAMVDAAHANNKGATAGIKSGAFNLGTSVAPVAINTTNVVKFVTSLQTVLQEQIAANDETWCVIPPWMHWCFVNSELKNAMMTGDPKSVLRTGFIGVINGMRFFVNTYLNGSGVSQAAPTAILAGNKEAIAYTLRMNEAGVYRTEDMESLLQGLMVWGWKAVKPEGLVNAYAYKASEPA